MTGGGPGLEAVGVMLPGADPAATGDTQRPGTGVHLSVVDGEFDGQSGIDRGAAGGRTAELSSKFGIAY